MRRILGELQRHLMIFGLSNNYVYSSFALIVGVFSSYKDLNLTGINIVDNKIETLTIVISIFSIIYRFFMETRELRNRGNEFFEIDLPTYKNKVMDSISLSEKYKKNGYELDEFNGEKYVMSRVVNRKLYLDRYEPKIQYLGDFILANEVRQVAPFALNNAFKSKRTIFNSKLIRLADDICMDRSCNKNSEFIRLQRTDYFQGLCTNEMVYRRLRKMTTIYDPFIFEGKQLMLDNESNLLSLCKSHCSNYLGGSTLAVTKDNYIILNRQSNSSHTNPGRIAPSGSGSTDYRDYKRLKENSSFQDLAILTMERELREECNLRYKNIGMNSRIIGFARLLERGGKPDFFGVTYMDINHDEIGTSFKESLEIGGYEIISRSFKEYKDIPDELYNVIKENPGRVSIQIYILAKILGDLYKDNIDVYGEL